ncbi:MULTISPECIES: hypothetical protein [unclassified Plantactinospora]|uniref:hypothetical protein n=1 Tax=unclassified Plantactinospora TaxID=2631981 RepID=UPI000D169D78|nr:MULTISPECIES: hypothetical protein [unclassified Plantactinospora]AVT32281.1 hypothetical protein C6361_25655 [Plantactinospora sp. BC1]AVT37260.1 hypothetical protein C6W10_13195 [Plantactinospora sp. BB1]
MTGGSGDGFTVDPTALESFSKTSYARADDFDEIRGRLRDGAVGRSSFGIMPASFTLYEQYESCLDECLQALADGSEVMEVIADAVTAERDSYVNSDAAAQARFGG